MAAVFLYISQSLFKTLQSFRFAFSAGNFDIPMRIRNIDQLLKKFLTVFFYHISFIHPLCFAKSHFLKPVNDFNRRVMRRGYNMPGFVGSLKRAGINNRQIYRRQFIPQFFRLFNPCLLYTSPSPRDYAASRMPSSA